MPASTAYSILLKKENAHDDPIYCCAWAKTSTSGDPKVPPKDFIATGGLDGLVKIWLFENNRLELVHSLAQHSMAVVSVAISADGHTLASTSLDSTLIIWDLLSGHKVHEIQNTSTDVWKVAFSPEGSHIVTGSHTGKLGVYGIEKASLDGVLDTRGRFVLSVAWSSNGKYIASGATDGAACIFDAAQGKLLHTIQAHTQAVNSVAFSPDSTLLLTASTDGSVHTYNVASGSLQNRTKLPSRASSASASVDGRAAAGDTNSVRVCSLHTLQELHVFKEHTGAEHGGKVTWVPPEAQSMRATRPAEGEQYDHETESAAMPSRAPPSLAPMSTSLNVCGVQFNAEGNKLLSVSKDRCINIYECPPPPKSAAKK